MENSYRRGIRRVHLWQECTPHSDLGRVTDSAIRQLSAELWYGDGGFPLTQSSLVASDIEIDLLLSNANPPSFCRQQTSNNTLCGLIEQPVERSLHVVHAYEAMVKIHASLKSGSVKKILSHSPYTGNRKQFGMTLVKLSKFLELSIS